MRENVFFSKLFIENDRIIQRATFLFTIDVFATINSFVSILETEENIFCFTTANITTYSSRNKNHFVFKILRCTSQLTIYTKILSVVKKDS